MLSHRHRYTVEDDYHMAGADILAPGSRVELIIAIPGLPGCMLDLRRLG
ncbi:MAG: hypothetical protein LJE69_12850 [Thiohalocapsa sp.]|jgi:hypothetical protein|nr:hypothetical protein [Thiohalocapsa sp.]MCG6942125.1 hypothetical protein [Thiohalocapsa sp.]